MNFKSSEKDKYMVYEKFVKRISCPHESNKKTWGDPVESKLALCIIELECHPLLPHVLYNACHLYGGIPDISLYIFHGNKNKEYIEKHTIGWNNIVLYNLKIDTLTPIEFNRILKNVNFWTHIAPDMVFMFNVYTLFRRPIPPQWFLPIETNDTSSSSTVSTSSTSNHKLALFDYVGAPWSIVPSRQKPWSRVGNGQVSIRNKREMVRICYFHPKESMRSTPEDLFYVETLENDRIAPFEYANMFAVESIIHPDPMCCLNIWKYMSFDFMIHLIETIPGYKSP